MNINLIKLKIKIKHLSLEPKIIRHEERKLLKQARWLRYRQGEESASDLSCEYMILRDHRKIHLRYEARATQLAYAFLRGKTYLEIENRNDPKKYWGDSDWMGTHLYKVKHRMINMIHKYQFGDFNFKDKDDVHKQVNKWLGFD